MSVGMMFNQWAPIDGCVMPAANIWWYLGAHPSDDAPTVNIDGSALIVGQLYYDTTVLTMKVWNGTDWVPVFSPVGATTVYYSATGGQTTFPTNIPDLNGNLMILPSTNLAVYRNGGLITPGVDYTIDLIASTITLTWPAGAGEIIAVLGIMPP